MRPIIFDMDGVLADSEIISCETVAQVLSEYGANLTTQEVLDRFVGISSAKTINIVATEQGLTFPDNIAEVCRDRTYQAFHGRLQPIYGMPAFIQKLPNPKCVASSSSLPRIELTLRTTGMLDTLAPHLFSSTMVENGKPAPDLFLHAAQTMGWNPSRCIVIEDSLPGVEAGKSAGMTVIGTTMGSHVTHEVHAAKLLERGALTVIQSTDDLTQILNDLQGDNS